MNWGIIGYGEIAPAFIEALIQSEKSKLVGIASISSYEYLKKKKLYDQVEIFDNYTDLVESPDIDIVYVSTTNNLHYENAKSVINAGKNLLCEKPLTPSATLTKEIIELARKNSVFLMEGMWTRFLPVYREFIKLIQNNVIGTPKFLKADFGFMNNWSKSRRLMNPKLFGGTLLDNADYNIFLSQDIFHDYPCEIAAQATYAETGVEDSCSILLKYPGGGLAQLFSSFRCQTKQEAVIYGDEGYIELNEYWHGTQIAIYTGKRLTKKNFPHKGNGFEYQIEAVEESVRNEKLENDLIPHDASIEVAKIIDEVKELVKRKK